MTLDFATNAEKIFAPPFYKISKANKRFVVVFGGAGSSKSYSVHQSELLKLMSDEKGDTLVFRKYGSDLRESSFKLFHQIIQGWGLQDYFKLNFSNDNRRITFLNNGKSIIFKGLDDSEKIKSITGIKRIIVEEASQIEFDDFLEIVRRARGFKQIQIVLILNPISEKHWIKTNLVDSAGVYSNETDVLKFTYHDNPFLDSQYINELERLKQINPNHYRIYVEAEWGIEDKTRKYAWAFDDQKHVKKNVMGNCLYDYKLPYNPNLILWLTFDFNRSPMTCTALQHDENKREVNVLKCFKLENAGTYDMCQILKVYYPNAIIKVTGDASGRNSSTIAHDFKNNYEIIQHELQLTGHSIVVPASNPSIEYNQEKLNTFLLNYTCNIDTDECKPLIYDLNYVEIDERKKIIKSDRSDEKQQSDFLDNFRYWINIAFRDIKLLLK